MPQIENDLLFCLTFLVVMAVLYSVRRRLKKASPAAYSNVMTGVLLLTLMSGVQLAAHQNLFQNLPFVASEINRQLVEAVLVVAGLIFLLTGTGMLIPSVTKTQSATVLQPA